MSFGICSIWLYFSNLEYCRQSAPVSLFRNIGEKSNYGINWNWFCREQRWLFASNYSIVVLRVLEYNLYIMHSVVFKIKFLRPYRSRNIDFQAGSAIFMHDMQNKMQFVFYLHHCQKSWLIYKCYWKPKVGCDNLRMSVFIKRTPPFGASWWRYALDLYKICI